MLDSLRGRSELSTLQVGLSVELGELSIPLNELAELVPGRTLEIEFDPQQPVALMLGAVCVAQAIFVTVEDQLALEITTILGDLPGNESVDLRDNSIENQMDDLVRKDA